jgi:hypothetical protein
LWDGSPRIAVINHFGGNPVELVIEDKSAFEWRKGCESSLLQILNG